MFSTWWIKKHKRVALQTQLPIEEECRAENSERGADADAVGAHLFFNILEKPTGVVLGICKQVEKERYGLFVLTDREPPQTFNVELSCILHAAQTVTDYRYVFLQYYRCTWSWWRLGHHLDRQKWKVLAARFPSFRPTSCAHHVIRLQRTHGLQQCCHRYL
jgi:hypothetical protein